MECSKCNTPLNDTNRNDHLGQTLCDDCYMEALSPVKTCDPWAAYNAQRFEVNHKEPAQLDPAQARILELITSAGEIEPDVLLARLDGQMTRSELERRFATLKHMGKVGARKAGGKIFLTIG